MELLLLPQILIVSAPLIIRCNGVRQILLVEEGFMKQLKTPGGKIDPGESNDFAGIRETWEEVRILISIFPREPHYMLDLPKGMAIHVYTYLAQIRKGTLTPHDKMRRCGWFDLREIPKLDEAGDLALNILPGLIHFGLR